MIPTCLLRCGEVTKSIALAPFRCWFSISSSESCLITRIILLFLDGNPLGILCEREGSGQIQSIIVCTSLRIWLRKEVFCMYLWPGRDQRYIWLPRPHCSWSHPSAHLGALWAWCKNALCPEHEETEHSGRWRTALGTTPTGKQQNAAYNSKLIEVCFYHAMNQKKVSYRLRIRNFVRL